MVGHGDDDQFIATNLIENAIRPIDQCVPAYPTADLFAYFFELKKERELPFDRLYKQLSVAGALLVVIVARFVELAASLITND